MQYIYDNVTYAPFIYADSYVEVLGSKKPGDTSHGGSTLGNPGSKERNKLEVYRNIAGKDLMHFRVDMGLLVPIKSKSSKAEESAQALTVLHQIPFRTPGLLPSSIAQHCATLSCSLTC